MRTRPQSQIFESSPPPSHPNGLTTIDDFQMKKIIIAHVEGIDVFDPKLAVIDKDELREIEFYHDYLPGFDEKRTKQLLRKMDRRLIPFLSFLYLLSFLDRSNIGNAKLDGLEHDLGLHGLQYNIALAVFFPFYVAAEIPSNLMMKKYTAGKVIGTIMLAWGTVMTLTGLVRNFQGLLACRMFLGLAEGGFFPGVTYYLTNWYRRHECGLRMAIFFSAATLAGAFGGILARGIIEMSGLGGLPGWAWIFILEGGITVFASFGAFRWITAAPEVADWLTEGERKEVRRRLEMDSEGLDESFQKRYIWDAIIDWKIWVKMVIAIGVYIPLYSFSLFLPSIVKGMGYSATESQLMSVPPYVLACCSTVAFGYLADRFRQRGIFIATACSLAASGFSLLIATKNPKLQYLGTFLAASGVYPNIPAITAWTGNNIGGSTKRGVGIAMQVGFGNLGGAVAAFSYIYIDAPRYTKGHALLIASATMSAALSLVMSWYLRKENRRRDMMMERMGRTIDGLTRKEREVEKEAGDGASFFRYTV